MSETHTLIALSERLQTAFKTLLPGLREFDVHSGEITRETIARVRKSAPSALLAQVRLSDIEPLPEGVFVTASFVLLLCAAPSGKGEQRLSASASGLTMAAAIARHLPGWDLGVECAEGLDIRDFTNQEDNRHSDSVRLLTWTHRVLLEDVSEEGVVPALYYAFTPETGLPHEGDYKAFVHNEAAS